MGPARIVLIEDNPADVHLLRHVLDVQGETYELQVLRDGAEALHFVEKHKVGLAKPDPCVILLDLHLPKYDGLEVLHAIKGESKLTHIDVVVLTTTASPKDQGKIQEMGALYRKKPTSLTEYMALAAEILAVCRGESPAAVGS
ncbi:MAG TPA: response regulator [Bryobacteraceae bacterium]|nr:response regulator [Bryobacteraceae bacterium]